MYESKTIFVRSTPNHFAIFADLYVEDIVLDFIRWLYTDFVEFDTDDFGFRLLPAAKYHQLPTLFERCEQAIVQKVSITSCAYIRSFATNMGSITILNKCKQLIASYYRHDLPSRITKFGQVDVDEDAEMTVSTFFFYIFAA